LRRSYCAEENRVRSSSGLVLLVLGAALLSCSRLPEYAAPKAKVIDPGSADLSDVITYWTLAREDFKGDQPPPEFAASSDRLGAATCAYLTTAPGGRWQSERVGSAFRLTPRQLRFGAVMNRNCSWWNPKDLGLPQDYILQHEQIHFAIFELEARRLNASAPELEEEVRATASTPDAAAAVQRNLERVIRGRLPDILARSRAFDEDTSMGHAPQAQKRWWEEVCLELGEAAC
jgi:hypothetical protein